MPEKNETIWLVKLIVRATSALWHKIKELLIKKEQ